VSILTWCRLGEILRMSLRIPSRKRDASSAPVDPLTESAWPRTQRDFAAAITSARLALFLIAVGVVAAALVGYIAQDNHLHPVATALWTVCIGIGTPGMVCAVVFLYAWERAPRRQRDEARAELARQRPATLAVEFSQWLREKRAALPPTRLRMLFRTRRGIPRMTPDERRRERARVEDEARTEYAARFRDSVSALLKGAPDATSPETLRDFYSLAEFVQAASVVGASAAWINKRLARGNELLEAWPLAFTEEHNDEMRSIVREWESETYSGLARYAPGLQERFHVDVGFGLEWHPGDSGEPLERAMLRRRIHRLSEIQDRSAPVMTG
jgi:hypothetical protein